MQKATEDSRTFFEVFSFQPSDPMHMKVFENVRILNVSFFKKTKSLIVKAASPEFVPAAAICCMEQLLAGEMGFDSASIKIKYENEMTLQEALDKYFSEILLLLNRKVALSKGILAGCTWEITGDGLAITLKSKGEKLLKVHSCEKLISEIIEDTFGIKTAVHFENTEFDEKRREDYLEYKESEETRISRMASLADSNGGQGWNSGNGSGSGGSGSNGSGTNGSGAHGTANTGGKGGSNGTSNGNNGKNGYGNGNGYGSNGSGNNGTGNGNGWQKKRVKKETGPDVIMGGRFNDTIMKMSEVTQDSGKIAVRGEITSVTFREIRGDRFLCSFDITDFTSTITAKFFVNKDDIDLRREQIKEKLFVKILGEAQYDKFSKELSVLVTDIVEIEQEKKKDNAAVKRVELHLHTQMSSMDAITPVDQLVKRAASWGHTAIAITDHGVVQAYPDAYSAGKKNNIKIIYGVECYLVDDGPQAVVLPEGDKGEYSLDEEFVVFDIETTGLSSDKDRITEIGAVKVRNGQLCERFATFVNPCIPIPDFIVRLTGITDAMVKDAPLIEEALEAFLQFAGNSPVVAHNASFDTGFISFNARKTGKTFNNAVVDTLQLSRLLLTSISKHKLNLVAKHLDIKLENHHRAVNDAETTAMIFNRFVEM
ncbi:MAG: PHP domain-containing protein, partial [Clostridiales bacterium]|nr:PHP domain-containing protein [Clostridiales bacterium]